MILKEGIDIASEGPVQFITGDEADRDEYIILPSEVIEH